MGGIWKSLERQGSEVLECCMQRGPSHSDRNSEDPNTDGSVNGEGQAHEPSVELWTVLGTGAICIIFWEEEKCLYSAHVQKI